jgi:hypothetical protein
MMCDLYTDLGATQEAAEIRQKFMDLCEPSSRYNDSLSSTRKVIPVTSVKIRRNDPCP